MTPRNEAGGDEWEWLATSLGASDEDSITLRGKDLASEIMGRLSFADLAFFLVSARVPDEGESELFNAVLVSLADHGLTPTVLAARLTHTGAPEALQGAVAAGLLGAGTVFLGPVADTAQFLHDVLEDMAPSERGDDGSLSAAADRAVREAVERGRRIPGLGHPIHRHKDPRTPRLYGIADETGLTGPHLRLLRLVSRSHQDLTGKRLPINGAGVAGAALADLGFPPSITRGFALLARTAGLVAHLAEEMEHPLGMQLWREVDRRAAERSGPTSSHAARKAT
jgi:citrate synthase